jgi:transcriptional regulator with XRE-family HTH domain
MSFMSVNLSSTGELGLAVRSLRLGQNLTMQELAARSGHSRDLIHRLESGRDVSSSSLFDVLQALRAGLEIKSAELPTLEEMRSRFGEPE